MKKQTTLSVLLEIRDLLKSKKVEIPEPLTGRKKLVLETFPEFIGKPMTELNEYLVKNYKDRLVDGDYVMNIELPKEKGVYQYFFKSLVRFSDGYWDVPCARWDGSAFGRRGYWLGSEWGSACRVVLLEI